MADGRAAGVLFDVDGTLVDTAYLHTVTWWEALRQAGRDVPMAAIHRALGMGPERMLARLLGPERDRHADGEIRAGHDLLFARYGDRLRPLPGARDLLRECAARGLRVVLATSATEREAAALRAVLPTDELVGWVTPERGGPAGLTEPDGPTGPEGAQPLAGMLDRSGLDRERTVCVGDSVWDVAAAGRLGLPCIGLTCGGTGRGELAGAGAVAVFDDPAALLAGLTESPLGQLA